MTTTTTAGSTVDQIGVAPPLGSDTSVTVAFAVGWQMAGLFAMAAGPYDEVTRAHVQQTLPTTNELSPSDRWDMLVRQAQAKVARLKADFARADVPEDGLDEFEELSEELIGHFEAGSVEKVRAAHTKLVVTLTVAHSRLGRAYGLGQGLADTCRLPLEATDADLDQAFGPRLGGVEKSLTDLASNLPVHSSRAVMLSLAQWQQWAAAPSLNGTEVTWPNASVVVAMHRQGELWRSLLSGEKLGKDMLGAANYFNASKTLFRRLVKSRPWVWVVLIAAATSAALGVYFVITAASAVKAISGIVLSVLGAVGISAASLKRTFADLEAQVGTEVWGAELDWAIAQAITVAPGDWGVNPRKADVPPRGPDPDVARHAATIRSVLTAAGGRDVAKVQAVVHKTCGVKQMDEARSTLLDRDKAANWLVGQAAVVSQHTETVPGDHGTLVSSCKDGRVPFFVWRFRHHKIAGVLVFSEKDDAWKAAGIAE